MGIFDFFKKQGHRKMIVEKDKKPDIPFEWEGPPDIYDHSSDFQEEEESESCEEETKPYEYILFADSIDMTYIMGSRQDHMRKDYTIDPVYYVSCQYLRKLWKDSNDIAKIIKTKNFFETLERFEDSLNNVGSFLHGKFNIELEKEYYFSKKDDLLIDFLDRSFTNEYRNALELKTPKGRISRIDHWFIVMDYYKKYLTPNALNVLEALQNKWTSELMPNLLECGE